MGFESVFENWYFYPLSHEVLRWFRSWKLILLSFFARDVDFLLKIILLSSSARGLKFILIHWYFYPPPYEVWSWSFKYWFAHLTGLTLDCQSNLILFRFYTWKPVKLGSVPVLHLKASQTWFCFGLTLESQSNLYLKFRHLSTYLDLPLVASLVGIWGSMKNSSDCIPTPTTERITFVHNHACRSIPNMYCHWSII